MDTLDHDVTLSQKDSLPPGIQALHIDAHREYTDIDETILELDALRKGLGAKNATDSLSEMSRKVRRLETNKVCTEYAIEQIVADGQASENLGGWECNVHEKTDRRVWKLCTEHLRKKHEMIVVHPDNVAFLVRRNDRVREPLVDCDVLFEGVGLVE